MQSQPNENCAHAGPSGVILKSVHVPAVTCLQRHCPAAVLTTGGEAGSQPLSVNKATQALIQGSDSHCFCSRTRSPKASHQPRRFRPAASSAECDDRRRHDSTPTYFGQAICALIRSRLAASEIGPCWRSSCRCVSTSVPTKYLTKGSRQSGGPMRPRVPSILSLPGCAKTSVGRPLRRHEIRAKREGVAEFPCAIPGCIRRDDIDRSARPQRERRSPEFPKPITLKVLAWASTRNVFSPFGAENTVVTKPLKPSGI